MSQSDMTHKIMKRLYSVAEVAEYTGLSIHTLYTMVSQRRIPFVKVGRLTKFDLVMLDAWIDKNTVLPMRCRPLE
ncbi:helix-turn-helix domain-containing protein [Nitrospira sp. Nam80]